MIGSISLFELKLREEFSTVKIKNPKSIHISLVAEARDKKVFSYSRWSGNNNISFFLNPIAIGKTKEHVFIQSPFQFEIYLLQRGLIAKLSCLNQPLKSPVISIILLGINKLS